MRPPEAPSEDRLELEFKYAWDWFQYHADQRLRAFHFFLILTSAVVLGYANAATDGSDVIAAAIGLMGAAIALAFVFLDLRNTQLVDHARCRLKRLEGNLDTARLVASDDSARKALISHSFWLRAIMGLVGLLSLLAAGWAIAGIPD